MTSSAKSIAEDKPGDYVEYRGEGRVKKLYMRNYDVNFRSKPDINAQILTKKKNKEHEIWKWKVAEIQNVDINTYNELLGAMYDIDEIEGIVFYSHALNVLSTKKVDGEIWINVGKSQRKCAAWVKLYHPIIYNINTKLSSSLPSLKR